MSTTTPTLTRNAAGNLHSSASLGAGASANNDTANYDAAFLVILTVKNTPGGTVAATRGLQIDIYHRYGSSPTTAPSPMMTFTLPSAVASTAETSPPIYLPGGQYNVKFTNLDASNAITVEATIDTVDNVVTA
jgi:hypothetical protein